MASLRRQVRATGCIIRYRERLFLCSKDSRSHMHASSAHPGGVVLFALRRFGCRWGGHQMVRPAGSQVNISFASRRNLYQSKKSGRPCGDGSHPSEAHTRPSAAVSCLVVATVFLGRRLDGHDPGDRPSQQCSLSLRPTTASSLSSVSSSTEMKPSIHIRPHFSSFSSSQESPIATSIPDASSAFLKHLLQAIAMGLYGFVARPSVPRVMAMLDSRRWPFVENRVTTCGQVA